MATYTGVDYPKGARVVFKGEPARIVAVGLNGNYVVVRDSGGSATAHHSELIVRPEIKFVPALTGWNVYVDATYVGWRRTLASAAELAEERSAS
jgi:hypothetical protein